jgi:RNA polymerase sigma-70 factor (ECF subfamily)
MKPLAARLAAGEESAFAELYDACADRLHRYLSWQVGSRDAAADVLQQAFLRAVGSRRKFGKVENPIAYLFQIARNEAARYRSTERKQKTDRIEIDAFVGADETESQRVDAEAAAAALGRLTAEDREIVELKIFGDVTFREIADIVAMPQQTVATRYRRALESLRPWLTRQFS